MAKFTEGLAEYSHHGIFDKENERRKKKIEPTAINKIAIELLIGAIKAHQKENHSK